MPVVVYDDQLCYVTFSVHDGTHCMIHPFDLTVVRLILGLDVVLVRVVHLFVRQMYVNVEHRETGRRVFDVACDSCEEIVTVH